MKQNCSIKKTFGFLLAGIFLLPLISACGGPGGEAGGTSAGGDATQTASADTSAGTQAGTQEETAEETTAETAPKELEPRDKSSTYNVLFIGNSFSYYNDMNKENGIFAMIARKAGYTGVKVSAVYKSGYYLRQFLDKTDSYGADVLEKLNSQIKYDIVVIQEQSANPINNPGDFYDSCREFKKLVDKNGGELWLYSTWGYKTGHSDLSKYGKSTADMEMKLRAAYRAISDELGVGMIYAGAAMTKSFADNRSIDLYNSDLKHPSPAGSYLIAWTIFGTVFGVDPAELTFDGTMTAENADRLRSVASYIVKNGAEVDPSYATASAGVHAPVSDTPVSGLVDSSKTVQLTSLPSDPIVSVIHRDEASTGNGWMSYKSKAGTFSGIRGDRDAIASTAYSSVRGGLTAEQKADIADTGYGVSVIGIEYMDASKKGTNFSNSAGTWTSVGNLVNGHWGTSYMAAMFFDMNKYNEKGETVEGGPYTALITLNFGQTVEFEAIGYFSGTTRGFAQAQDVYVSDNGTDWTKVESACYDVAGTTLTSLSTSSHPDPWNNNTATVFCAFSMGRISGKYIRIGIIRGGEVGDNNTGLSEINTREIAVFGKAKQ